MTRHVGTAGCLQPPERDPGLIATPSRYSASFSSHLASLVHAQLSSSDATLAFISCPTAYVGFQHAYDRGNTYLLEYDTRFALLSEQEFVRYDLDEPLALPEGLKGKVDFMVVDPPFLNEVRWTQHAARCTS